MSYPKKYKDKVKRKIEERKRRKFYIAIEELNEFLRTVKFDRCGYFNSYGEEYEP